MIRHAYNVIKSTLRERKKRKTRSPKWRSVEHAHLKAFPNCASCGGTARLAVHHVRPFHLFPELELEPSNLITLCMSLTECHLRLGHGDFFGAYVEAVVELSARTNSDPASRPVVEQEAKSARKR